MSKLVTIWFLRSKLVTISVISSDFGQQFYYSTSEWITILVIRCQYFGFKIKISQHFGYKVKISQHFDNKVKISHQFGYLT